MYQDLNNTLLALLFSLKDLNSPLTQEEKATLFDIAEQLSVNPSIKTWKKLTEPTLCAVIQRNKSLKQHFQTVKSHLDRLDHTISLELLPTETELDQIAPKKKQPQSFVLPDDSDNRKNYETTNMVIFATSRILKTPQPDETVKRLSRLDKKRITSA